MLRGGEDRRTTPAPATSSTRDAAIRRIAGFQQYGPGPPLNVASFSPPMNALSCSFLPGRPCTRVITGGLHSAQTSLLEPVSGNLVLNGDSARDKPLARSATPNHRSPIPPTVDHLGRRKGSGQGVPQTPGRWRPRSLLQPTFEAAARIVRPVSWVGHTARHRPGRSGRLRDRPVTVERFGTSAPHQVRCSAQRTQVWKISSPGSDVLDTQALAWEFQ